METFIVSKVSFINKAIMHNIAPCIIINQLVSLADSCGTVEYGL